MSPAKKKGATCTVPKCGQPLYLRGLCKDHWADPQAKPKATPKAKAK